jgi:hypothetical protein
VYEDLWGTAKARWCARVVHMSTFETTISCLWLGLLLLFLWILATSSLLCLSVLRLPTPLGFLALQYG